jgi:uncharacterized protein YbjT (DUF2867 family)
MRRAIVFGASGFVGSYLLEALLGSPDYDRVTAIVRKPLAIRHAKLNVLIGDYHTLPGLRSEIQGDDLFITLGTTRKNSPNQAEYYQVDHDYPVLAARIAKDNGVKSVFVVTAVGADLKSAFSYTRTKGEVERDLIQLDFEHTHIFRPSMLMGSRKEKRPLEKTLIGIWRWLNPLLLGMADRYRGITGEALAVAIVNAASNQSDKVKIYHWREMIQLVHAGSASRS